MPEEDQGYIMAGLQHAGRRLSAAHRSVMAEVEEMLAEYDAIENLHAIAGYSIADGHAAAECRHGFLQLKDWDDRPDARTMPETSCGG